MQIRDMWACSWSPRVNFTNILLEAFTCADPKTTKKNDSLTVFFVLLESAHVKASSKMLVKLTHYLSHIWRETCRQNFIELNTEIQKTNNSLQN